MLFIFSTTNAALLTITDDTPRNRNAQVENLWSSLLKCTYQCNLYLIENEMHNI